MIPDHFIKRIRTRKLNRSKTAETSEPNGPGEHRKHSAIKRLFTSWTKRSGNRLKRRRLIGCQVAEYKTIDGHVFNFWFPTSDTENIVTVFKKCFRVIGPERVEFLHTFTECGLRIPIGYFCESYDPESDQCKGCGLIEIKEQRENAK